MRAFSTLAVVAGLLAASPAQAKLVVAVLYFDNDSSNRDYDVLQKVARQNGWEVRVEHAGPDGGRLLRFFSPLDELSPEVTLRYGESLTDFTPRETKAGKVNSVSANVWASRTAT